MGKFNTMKIQIIFISCICYTRASILYTGNCTIQNLEANCVDLNLTSVPEDLPEGIKKLDLSLNNITLLRNSSFFKYINLRILILDKNDMFDIKENAFVGLTNLETLSLTANRINATKLRNLVFKPLSNLTNLFFNRNMDKHATTNCTYSDTAFGYLTNLKNLSLDLCNLPIFGKGFRRLEKLQKLTFDFCLANSLDNSTFENFFNSNISILELSGCTKMNVPKNADKNTFSYFPKLTVLDLSNSFFGIKNALLMLFPFENRTMEMINFHYVNPAQDTSGNHLATEITDHTAKYLRTICVRTIVLSKNRIFNIGNGSILTFRNASCTENVIVSGNNFGLTGVQIIELLSKFENIKLLDIAFMPIAYPYSTFFAIRNGHVSPVYGGNDGVTDDKNRNISNKGRMTWPLPKNIEVIRYSHVLTWHIDFHEIKISNVKKLKFLDLSYIQCGELPSINVIEPMTLDFLDFSGSNIQKFTAGNVVHSASVIEFIDNRLEQSFYQNENPLKSFTNTMSLNISSNHLSSIPRDAFVTMSNMAVLNISKNYFYRLPQALLTLTNLRQLDVRMNRLQTIDKEITDWLDVLYAKNRDFTLYLQGNDFDCSCDTQHFILWLSQTDIKFDVPKKHYPCRLPNGTYANISYVMKNFHNIFNYCNLGMWIKVGIGSIVSAFVVICLSAVFYQYRWRFTYYLYRNMKKTYIQDQSATPEFEYDLFIAYASDTTEWIINTFLPVLEKEWNLQTCVKDRDFPVGADKSETIISYIRKSKFVVFIVSPRFIVRKWGSFEIEIAKYEMFENRGHKKIILITKNGTKISSVPTEFNYIWKDIALIEWPEEGNDIDNFWFNLKLQLH